MTSSNISNIQRLLESLSLIRQETLEEFLPRVRDREDIRVLRCRNSRVIFLDYPHGSGNIDYTSRSDFTYWDNAQSRQEATQQTLDDDKRRFNQFEPLIHGKKWLDFGTGNGGILDLLCNSAKEVCALEIQEGPRKALLEDGYRVEAAIESFPEAYFDIITLFHVLEHLPDPIETLRQLKGKLTPGGRLIIEVPHARDFLLDFFESEPFKNFTLWSEHLILHTRESLSAFLIEAGFKNFQIKGFQRFPLANHLHWLARGKPGGHTLWSMLKDDNLDRAYADLLDRLDGTDTLISFVENS